MHRDVKPDNILIDNDGHLILADFGVSRSFGDPSESRPWERSRRWAKAATTNQLAVPINHVTPNATADGTCTPCGTPGFMAPETFGHGGYSYEADIWSAGVVIHYLLMGRVSTGTDARDFFQKLICYCQLPFGMIPAKQTYKELSTRTKVLQLEFGMDERVPGHARMLLRRVCGFPVLNSAVSFPHIGRRFWRKTHREGYLSQTLSFTPSSQACE